MTPSQDIRINPNRLVNLAQKLIRIPSPLWAETAAARFLDAYLQGVGLDSTLQAVPTPGGHSHQTVARWQGSQPGPKVLLCGHLDILELFQPDRWTVPPYEAALTDGWLYGHGSLNMKAGLAAIVAAVEALLAHDFQPRGEIVIAGVMGETPGGVGIQHLLRQERDFDFAIVAEPTNLTVSNISVGTVQGWLRLWGDKMAFQPHPNPIYGMAKILAALGPAYAPPPANGWLTFDPCPDLPGYPRFNAGKINSGQDYCEIFFDARIVPGQSDETVRADLMALLQTLEADLTGMKAEITIPAPAGTTNFPAAPALSLDHPLAQALIRNHANLTGQPPKVGAGDRMGLASDASHLRAAGIYALEYGPGKHPRWPMVDERIWVEDVITAAQVLADTLVGLMNGSQTEQQKSESAQYDK